MAIIVRPAICQYPKFKVYENNTGIWTDVADIDFSNLPIPANAGKIINAHDYFYQPMSSSQIRIEAQNCFYLRVYTGEAADLKRQFPDWEQLTTIYHCGNGACDSGENFVTCPLIANSKFGKHETSFGKIGATGG